MLCYFNCQCLTKAIFAIVSWEPGWIPNSADNAILHNYYAESGGSDATKTGKFRTFRWYYMTDNGTLLASLITICHFEMGLKMPLQSNWHYLTRHNIFLLKK